MKKKKKDEFVYCSNWNCNDYQCMRHHIYHPWNVPTRQKRWNQNKNGGCEAAIYDKREEE